MFVEFVCVVGLCILILLTIKKKDIIYPISFILCFLLTPLFELNGVLTIAWKWKNILPYFNIGIMGIPLAALINPSNSGFELIIKEHTNDIDLAYDLYISDVIVNEWK